MHIDHHKALFLIIAKQDLCYHVANHAWGAVMYNLFDPFDPVIDWIDSGDGLVVDRPDSIF